jgi:HD-GYP domain-containing protein (c-di-GMP phosphodiesterase class II)
VNDQPNNSLSTASRRLIERCAALGMPAWLCCPEGRILAQPLPEAEEQQFRTRTEARVREIAAAFDPLAGEAEPVELEPGVLATPILIGSPYGRRYTLVAVSAPDKLDVRTLRWMAEDLAHNEEQSLAITDLSDQLVYGYEQTISLYRIGRSMNCLKDPEQFIQATCAHVRQVLGYEWVAVRYVTSSLAIDGLEDKYIISGGVPQPVDEFMACAKVCVDQMTEDSWTCVLSPGRHDLADLSGSQVIMEPIAHDQEVIGVLMAGGKQGDDPDVSSIETQLLDTVADLLGVFHQNVNRFEVQRSLFMGTVRALSSAIDAKHPYTHGHSERVAYLARELARSVGLGEDEVERVHIAGIVHDVGKIGVAEATLSKPGLLTDEEFEEIKRHPVVGYEILKDIPPMREMLPGVLHHHERWDGGGYPHRLAGEDIPLMGRLIAVADAFDAMSSTRSYRDELPRAEVHRRLREGAGSQWDANLVAAFLELDLSVYDEMMAQAGFVEQRSAA